MATLEMRGRAQR